MSHSADIFRSGDPFSVSLVSGIEKFYASEAYLTIFDFLSNFFCLTVPNNFLGEPFSVSIISGIEKKMERVAGNIRFFRLVFLSHSAKKFRRGTF